MVNEVASLDLSDVKRDIEIRDDEDFHALRVDLGEDAYLEVIQQLGGGTT